ncbi:MAG: acyltransferase [Elusimicrobia bacterium]|nr:acyltransferase [Elusimicrobiota bacterium]
MDSRRAPGLDLIRAAAIALVVLHHARALPGCPDAFRWIALRSAVGVDAFFVLSGWLIGGQLFRELAATGRVDVLRFWVRRWMRTLPAYYACLVPVLAYQQPGQKVGFEAAFFAQNYAAPFLWLITWSLCIEEHFYLLLPIAALLVARLRLNATVVGLLFAAALLSSPMMRWAGFQAMHAGTYRGFLGAFYGRTHLRLDGLCLGVACAALKQWRPASWDTLERRGVLLAAAGTVVFAVAAFCPGLTGWTSADAERMRFFNAVPGMTFASLGVALALPLAAAPSGRADSLLKDAAAWVADHAYALYLTHDLAIALARLGTQHLGAGFWLSAPSAALFAIAFAIVLRAAVELPGLAWRESVLGVRARP